jgi:hypothetical protein
MVGDTGPGKTWLASARALPTLAGTSVDLGLRNAVLFSLSVSHKGYVDQS